MWRDLGGGNMECRAEGEGTQPKKITRAKGRIIQVVNIRLSRLLGTWQIAAAQCICMHFFFLNQHYPYRINAITN